MGRPRFSIHTNDDTEKARYLGQWRLSLRVAIGELYTPQGCVTFDDIHQSSSIAKEDSWSSRLIGIEGSITTTPLPHHRMFGSRIQTSVAPRGTPPMPSANFSPRISADYSALSPLSWLPTSLSTGEGSHGQLVYRPCIDAGFVKHRALRMEDFTVTCPLVPGVPHLVSGSCSSPRTFAPRFLQTPPHGDALALPLSFGSTHTWTGDFHPRA